MESGFVAHLMCNLEHFVPFNLFSLLAHMIFGKVKKKKEKRSLHDFPVRMPVHVFSMIRFIHTSFLCIYIY